MKRSRTQEASGESLAQKTETVRALLANKVALLHMMNTVLDADRLIRRIRRGDGSGELGEHLRLAEELYGRQALANHLLRVDVGF